MVEPAPEPTTFGFAGGAAVLVLGALLFLVPGVAVLMLQLKGPTDRDRRKAGDDRRKAVTALGFALVAVGVAVGLGMGLAAVMQRFT